MRPERIYMGIRTTTPFKGMSKVVGGLLRRLDVWVAEQGVEAVGPPFLRLHVVDMRGSMDITCGICVDRAFPEDGDIRADRLPAGRYASLIYSGGGIAANRALIEWARAQGLEFDRWDSEQGDNFAGRYESFLADRRTEVAIKLVEEGSK